MAINEIKVLRDQARDAGREFSGKTMPSLQKRLLDGKIEVTGGVVSAEVPLNRRQISVGRTYLSEVEKSIARMADDAQKIDDQDALIMLLNAMAERKNGVESLTPGQLSEKLGYAALLEELSVLRLGSESMDRLKKFVSRFLPKGSGLVLDPQMGRSAIYLANFKNQVGSLSVVDISMSETWLPMEIARLLRPILRTEYSRTYGNPAACAPQPLKDIGDFPAAVLGHLKPNNGDFLVSSLHINVSINGGQVQGMPREHMGRMFANQDFTFVSFLNAMLDSAIEEGIDPKAAFACVESPKNYTFAYRSLESKDSRPSKENGFRETLVEAEVAMGPFRGNFENGTELTIRGKITEPDGAISMAFATESVTDTYVYDRKKNDFRLQGY